MHPDDSAPRYWFWGFFSGKDLSRKTLWLSMPVKEHQDFPHLESSSLVTKIAAWDDQLFC